MVVAMADDEDAALRLDIDEIEADLKKRIANVDASAPDAGQQFWHAFLGHAARPLEPEPSRYPDSDAPRFSVETPPGMGPRVRTVSMQRRIGLQEPGWGYIGTIVSALHLAVTIRRTRALTRSVAKITHLVVSVGH